MSVSLSKVLEKRSKSKELHRKIQMVMDLLTGHGSAPVGGLLTSLSVGLRAV